MLSKVSRLDARLLTRRCVSCGYDGALLRGGQARMCARCGCDLRERPARSYAEMEGLLGQLPPTPPMIEHLPRESTLIHRWLAVLFVAIIGLLCITYLASAAFAMQ